MWDLLQHGCLGFLHNAHIWSLHRGQSVIPQALPFITSAHSPSRHCLMTLQVKGSFKVSEQFFMEVRYTQL